MPSRCIFFLRALSAWSMLLQRTKLATAFTSFRASSRRHVCSWNCDSSRQGKWISPNLVDALRHKSYRGLPKFSVCLANSRIGRPQVISQNSDRSRSGAYPNHYQRPGDDRMASGTVKWFNPTKGYGFIQPQGGGKDVFVHISAVERAGLNTLNEGQTIQYEIVSNRGKESAENLKVR